jgi:hypothetical protein
MKELYAPQDAGRSRQRIRPERGPPRSHGTHVDTREPPSDSLRSSQPCSLIRRGSPVCSCAACFFERSLCLHDHQFSGHWMNNLRSSSCSQGMNLDGYPSVRPRPEQGCLTLAPAVLLSCVRGPRTPRSDGVHTVRGWGWALWGSLTGEAARQHGVHAVRGPCGTTARGSLTGEAARQHGVHAVR